jgi:hypothetical protein
MLNVIEGGVRDLLYPPFNIGANAPLNQRPINSRQSQNGTVSIEVANCWHVVRRNLLRWK